MFTDFGENWQELSGRSEQGMDNVFLWILMEGVAQKSRCPMMSIFPFQIILVDGYITLPCVLLGGKRMVTLYFCSVSNMLFPMLCNCFEHNSFRTQGFEGPN